jgi:YesN/AraC family two-component response regulator
MGNQIPLGIDIKNNTAYNVMIADDSKSERMLLQRFLKSVQFNVVYEAINGQDVVDNLLHFGNIDILCIDYEMPFKNGIDAVQEIRPLYPNLFIILITCHTEKEIVEQCINLKINAFIVKPLSKRSLNDKLIKILGREDILDKMVLGTKV